MIFKYIGFVSRAIWPILHHFPRISKYAKHPECASLEERYAYVRKMVLKVNKALHMDIHVEGFDYLKDEKYYLTCNHQALVDPLVWISCSEKPVSFVAKKELEKAPFVGKIMKAIDCEFMDRDNLKQSLMVMRRVKESFGKDQKDWLIYPEGTRNKTLENKKVEEVDLLEFKHGTFKIPLQTEIPVVPVMLYGTWRVLKPFHSHYKKYPIDVHVLKPIEKETYQNMNSTQLCEMIYQESLKEILMMKEKNIARLKRK